MKGYPEKKHRRDYFWVLVVLLLIVSASIALFPEDHLKIYVPEDEGYVEAYFTSTDNVTEVMNGLFQDAQNIRCAFYDVGAAEIISSLEENRHKLKLIVDDSSSYKLEKTLLRFTTDSSRRLMHNKFCVLDSRLVVTGSMNPTERGIYHNDNSLLVIGSEHIAKNYIDEFKEMDSGIFSGGGTVSFPEVYLEDRDILIENYFFPEDNCKERVMEKIISAEKSILFMTFSFTDDDIGDILFIKKQEGLEVRGIFDKTQAGSRYSEYQKLKSFSVLDNNRYTMHHKTFIIDNKTVIVGSYNPSQNADRNNDENLLIIHDPYTASRFLEEFERLYK